MNDEELDRTIKQLPSTISPSRDLWPGIESRMQEADLKRSFRRGGWIPANSGRTIVAGLSGLATAAAAFLLVYYGDRSHSEDVHTAIDMDLPEIEEGLIEQGRMTSTMIDHDRSAKNRLDSELLLSEAENGAEIKKVGTEPWPLTMFGDHQVALAILEPIFLDKRETMDPQLVDLFRQRLAVADNAIEQSHQAFALEPSDLSLAVYVQDAYQSKLELLDWANSLEE